MLEARRVVINHGSTSQTAKPVSRGAAVIAVAVVCTILVLALIGFGVFYFFRRRSQKTSKVRHNNIDSNDRSIGNANDFASKTPLMQQEDQPHTEYRVYPESKYEEEDGADLSAPPASRRSFSGISMQSLPPSYAAAVPGGRDNMNQPVARTMSHNRHNRDSSVGGSDGLRPLFLVEGQRDEQDISDHRGRDDSDKSSLMAPRPAGRPRAGSRFREENLDL